jgi:DNA-binding NtrC family response regulator
MKSSSPLTPAPASEAPQRSTDRPPALIRSSLAPAPQLQFCLRVTHGAELGLLHTIGAAPVIVGTSASSDVCLSDRSVSRAHCQLFARDGECVIRDLGSTNGTYVDGVMVVEALVPVGSRLRLGTTELRLEQQTGADRTRGEMACEFGELVGGSPAMTQVFGELQRVARTSLTCLLLGETGTGKELAARAVHAQSDRADKPFLVVDCAGVGPQFMEDKLFGHQKGAFTGATAAVPGVFEQANGGTVFLDEIGELHLELQAKLLGVLERREATRIGSHTPIKLDVRLVAATHCYLSEMVRRGTFREDLLYRLSEFTLRIPSLHERAEDIELIAQALLEREGFASRKLSADAVEYLQQLRWPGNVRELRNLLRRAAILTSGTIIDQQLLEDLAASTAEMYVPRDKLDAAMALASGSNPPTTLRPSTAPARPGGSGRPRTTPQPQVSLAFDSRATQELDPKPEAEPVPPDCSQFALPLEQSIDSHRRAYMHYLRQRYGNDLQAAAAHAGVPTKSVSRLFRQYGAY